MICTAAGVCSFAARPDKSALQQPVYWSADADPGVINLIETPRELRSPRFMPVGVPTVRFARDGSGIHIRAGPRAGVQLALRNGARTGEPVAALIPLDDMAADRLRALERFIRQRKQPFDERITEAQRRRSALMLRALDGRTEGASQHAIAVSLFGQRLIDGQDWSSSSFRYLTARLIRDGLRLVQGGYLRLLRSKSRS